MSAPQLFAVSLITALGLIALMVAGRNDDAHIEQFGTSLAGALASQAIEPFLAEDLIHLGVLSNRISSLEEVAGATIYTVEDRLLTSSGDIRRGRPFTEPLIHEGSIVGYVRLHIDESRFGSTFPGTLVALALAWASLVPAALLSIRWLGARRWPLSLSAPAELAPPEIIVAQEPEPRFLVVVNLFNQLSLGPERRTAELSFARRLADIVAELYHGRVHDLPGTGLLLEFAPGTSDDRPFHVVCAAFVLSRLLREADSWGRYRIGVHRVLLDPAGQPDPVDDSVTDAAVLSALAREETLVLSAALLAEMRYPQRLTGEPMRHPLLRRVVPVVLSQFDALVPEMLQQVMRLCY